MFVRNLNSGLQLCNGRRLIIRGMFDSYKECYILTGTSKGHDVFIPRRDLALSDSNLPSISGS
jgi:hypothetical protein